MDEGVECRSKISCKSKGGGALEFCKRWGKSKTLLEVENFLWTEDNKHHSYTD